ncbi:hypothetical protein ACSFCW_09245 [Yokenella regensburgei]|uniref:hypothetical protein n=1 Tax=Yokenella regensburgei TaxID=158877 RepID=UPI003ED98C4E
MFENYTEGARFFLVALLAGLIGIIALIFFMIFPPGSKTKSYVIPERKGSVTLVCSSESYGGYLDEDDSDRTVKLPDKPGESGLYYLKQSGAHRWSLYDAKEKKEPH